jgi:hypothetical protein
LRRYLILLLVVASFAAISVPASPAARNNPAAAAGLHAICVAGGGSFSISSLGLAYNCTTTNLSGFRGWSNLCVTQAGQATWVAALTADGYNCDNTAGG